MPSTSALCYTENLSLQQELQELKESQPGELRIEEIEKNIDILIIDREDTIPKKHKKHKHKKHKRKRSELDTPTDMGKPKSTSNGQEGFSESPGKNIDNKIFETPKSISKKKKIRGNRESGTSSDEERWLDAIQSGKLEEVDEELKKIKPKDPKLMTARQRAMLERKGDAVPDPAAEQLLSLPSGYREKVMTPEMIKKAALKSQKRKQLMDEKREKDKKRTMERLLKKQDNKQTKQAMKKTVRKSGLTICYRNNAEGIYISLPPGVEFPLEKKIAPPPPIAVKCGVEGCANLKKYSCSKTGVPLCSLECYKINLASRPIAPA